MSSSRFSIGCRIVSAVVTVWAIFGGSAQAAVIISSGTTSNMACANGLCSPTATDAVLNASDLETLLASGNVTVTTTGSGVQATDISVTAPITWSGASTLGFDAYQSLSVEQWISISGVGGLSVVTNDGGSGGTFLFGEKGHATFADLASPLTINGTAYILVGNIATLASAVEANPNGSFALAADYNAKADGKYSYSPVATLFNGHFQGLGNSISNLTIVNKRGNTGLGLFAFTNIYSSISNLVLRNADVSETLNGNVVGTLVGESYGLLSGDHSEGGRSRSGHRSNVGGLAGGNLGSIVDSSSSSAVGADELSFIGGLTGQNFGDISGCFTTGAVTILNSKSHASAAGGLAGYSHSGIISNSYAAGPVVGATLTKVGGLLGQFANDSPPPKATVATSYSTGNVSTGAQGVAGGVVGIYSSGKFSNVYWDTTTSGTDDAAGNDATLHGVTGVTSKQLKSGLPAGFDPAIWAEDKKINNGLPYLLANPPRKN